METANLFGTSFKLTKKQAVALIVILDHRHKFIKLWGGSRSGKTFLICIIIILRAIKYKRSTHIICRYAKQTAGNTVWLQTLLPLLEACQRAGACKVNYSQKYAKFKNGSIILTGGLRPSDIGNILSSEYATFFICEANEINWNIVDQCRARLNSLAKDKAGNTIQCKFLIDLNPTFEHHWSNVAWIRGIDPETKEPLKEFAKFANVHFNPKDNEENLSEGFLDTLESLSGSRRLRFLEGRYGSFEGLVYSAFNESMIVDDFEIPADWKKIRSIDFGYSIGHEFVCLWLAVDASNERVICYREHVRNTTTVRINAGHVKELSGSEKYGAPAICDHDAEDRATLEENGIKTKPAEKAVDPGLDNMIDFMERDKILVFRSCVETINEFYSYRWKTKEGSIGKDREVIKENDNCMDAFRYGLNELFPFKKKNKGKGGSFM